MYDSFIFLNKLYELNINSLNRIGLSRQQYYICQRDPAAALVRQDPEGGQELTG